MLYSIKTYILHKFQNITQIIKISIILLIILNGEGWHYLAVTRLVALLGGIASNKNSDFFFQNCRHSSRRKTKPKSLKASM